MGTYRLHPHVVRGKMCDTLYVISISPRGKISQVTLAMVRFSVKSSISAACLLQFRIQFLFFFTPAFIFIHYDEYLILFSFLERKTLEGNIVRDRKFISNIMLFRHKSANVFTVIGSMRRRNDSNLQTSLD